MQPEYLTKTDHPVNPTMLAFFNELRDGGATIFLVTRRHIFDDFYCVISTRFVRKCEQFGDFTM